MLPPDPQRAHVFARRPDGASSRWRPGSALRTALGVLVLGCVVGGRAVAAEWPTEGVPATRVYPLEEIGCTSREVQLLHDSFGRVAVAQQDEVFVLNDATWQKVSRGNMNDLRFHRLACAPDGEIFFCAFGTWGICRRTPTGELVPVSAEAADAPAWARSCDFREIRCTDNGVFFWGQDGVVFLDRRSGTCRYVPVGGTSCLFPLDGEYVVATFGDGLHRLDLEAGVTRRITINTGDQAPVIAAVGDGRSGLLLATSDRRLLALRGGEFEPVRFGDTDRTPGIVTAMTELAEGGFAATISNYGVVLLDRTGVPRRFFNTGDFRGVTALISMEPGVLWAVAERGVLKVLHGQPFTSFGRDQGLSVFWPQIVRWRGRTIVESGGRVYEALRGDAVGRDRFRLLAGQPEVAEWGIAALGDTLLIGSWLGVHEAVEGGEFPLVFSGVNVARLVPLDANTCLAIAPDAIAAIRREGGKWVECAKRIPGVGYPYVAHAGNGSAWLELAMNRVARIALVGGELQLRLVERFDWKEPSWVNVSIIGRMVALSASGRVPMFLDEETLELAEAPMLRDLVTRVPYSLQRFARDDSGTLWVSHARGLFPAREVGGRYEPDLGAFTGINEATPLVHCPPGDGVWASTDSSLFLVAQDWRDSRPAPVRPVLVALRDTRAGALLPLPGDRSGGLGSLRYAQNSLQLDFFAGSYASVRSFAYDYRLGGSGWTRANAGYSVFLPDLREGNYAFEVRAVNSLGPVGEVTTYRFAVAPPWYRSWGAVVAYPMTAFLLLYLAMRYAAHRQRVRMVELERQVDSRTAELRTAMECLSEESVANATLAERNRLASEIHDSLEQGFAGLFLQLESTSRLSACDGAVKSGLRAAIDMVSYCRDELRNAVRGLHSPILESESLEAALRRIVAQISPLAGFATVWVEGEPRSVDPSTAHHLLRIAQEALGNVVKHAGATRVEVVLCFDPRETRLSVVDDGHGFDPTKVVAKPGQHMGLPGFAERARKIGGSVEISSRPGHGTSVCVVVPWGNGGGQLS